MKKDMNQKKKSSNFHSMNDYLQNFKKKSVNEDLDQKTINTFNTLNTLDEEITQKDYNTPFHYKSEMRNKLNEKLKLINPITDNYVNEVMKSDLKILSKENAELKFCLNKLNKKFEIELKDLKLKNINKSKELDKAKEIIKKNTSLIELLGEKIKNYEKIFKEIESKNKQKTNIDKEIKDKLLNVKKENEELKNEINERDEIIKSFKDEIDSKKEIFDEIDKMKLDMEAYLKTMDKLYKEIEKKDKEINELKNNIDLMDKKHQQEIENIKKNKNINNNINNPSSNDELINEITQSKEKQIQLTKELIDIQKNYNVAKNNNIKMQTLAKEASEIIKKSIVARDKMKDEYDKAIKDLIDKYEKDIQIMKLIIVEQNEKFEKQLDDLKKGKKIDDVKDIINDKDVNNDNDKDKDKEKQKEYLEKLKKDNTMLIEQNLELKNMNEMLLSKMKDLPNINNKFNELFETVKLLKEENDLLKQSMKNSKIFNYLNKEHDEEEKEDENENSNDNNNENKEHINKGKDNINNKENNNKDNDNKDNDNKDNDNKDNDNKENDDENQKLSIEELQMLETILKDVENNKGGDLETNQKKLDFLEKILKKIENKNDDDNKDEDKDGDNKDEDNKDEDNNEEGEENEEEEKNNEKLNLQKQLLLLEMLKNLGENDIDEKEEKKGDNSIDKNDDNNELPIKTNNINNSKNDELLKDKINNINNPTKVYNKKIFKVSPKITKNSLVDKNKDNNENDNNEKIKTEEDNEEEEEDEDEENVPNQINENFNLYKPTKEGMLSFSLSKKNYSTTVPNKFDEFLKVFDPETSVQYNTLEGLFIIPSNKCNQLYYYSSKKNIINELFSLNENHSGGCLFLDNISKNIIALGGSESKAVEKFSLKQES